MCEIKNDKDIYLIDKKNYSNLIRHPIIDSNNILSQFSDYTTTI